MQMSQQNGKFGHFNFADRKIPINIEIEINIQASIE